MTEQERFETILKKKNIPTNLQADGRYHNLFAYWMWEGWQAAIESRDLVYKLSDYTGVTVEQNAGCDSDKGAAIVNRKPMTEVEAMQIVSTRPYGTLVNSLHYAIRETELFHGIGK